METLAEIMARVMRERQADALTEERAAVRAALADEVRGLIEATVFTGVDDAEIDAVRAEVAALTARLSAVRRSTPPTSVDGLYGLDSQIANPVSGALNPVAPPVRIETLPGGGAYAEFTLSHVYEGPPHMVHGGVSALILDQLLGLAAAANGTPGMTATLSLTYRRPTLLGVPLRAEARVARVEGRKRFVDAQVLDPDGKVTIEATAMFVQPRVG
ncbi:PaaI family thioesterase [Actinomadura craniellae]|uniref:PaaI family thioesterase n=1 Tax=Actinomadura craniellae TaxID=2231787 RepID=UPI001314736E|nr:PaaI family thioesterase [Actinomadura craniellae]